MKKLLRANGRCKAAKKEFTRVPAGSYKFIFLRKTNAVPPKAFNCCHCHLDGNCLKSAVIYQAIVATEDNRPAETYVGLTENSFKTRYSNHKSSFRRCMTFTDCRLQTADRRLQTADCRLQTADCIRQQDYKLNETKSIVIKVAPSSTFREVHVRPRSEVYIFHANNTDLIPKEVVGCSCRIELEQNNVCRRHKLAYRRN